MITFRIEGHKELEEVTAQALNILLNLRYWEAKWHDEGGSNPKAKMKRWQDKADHLISKYAVKENVAVDEPLKNEEPIDTSKEFKPS